MDKNKGSTNFMSDYNKMVRRIKSGVIVRKQYGEDNDSVIYLDQQEPISEAEKSKLIKKINNN